VLASALGVKSDILESADVFFRKLIRQPENIAANEALVSFVEYAESMAKFPVLIVDKANLVLGGNDGIVAISKTLQTIVQLTKQSNRLTVILASSSMVTRTSSLGKKMNSNLIWRTSRPCCLWARFHPRPCGTFWQKFGMGENLASLLIASYGGHFLRLLSAVDRLKTEKEDFFLASELNAISAGIVACFQTHPTRTLSLLRQLAKVGFALVLDTKDWAVGRIWEDLCH
jgi:hypothetical protein